MSALEHAQVRSDARQTSKKAKKKVNGFDFLIADSDPIAAIDNVEADLGPELCAHLHATGSYNKVIGYLTECELAGIDTTIVHAEYFTGVRSGPDIPCLSDPLLLAPGDAEYLAFFIAKAQPDRLAEKARRKKILQRRKARRM